MRDPLESLESLLRAGSVDGPSIDEALRVFAAIRSTPDEGRAVQRLVARHTIEPLPERLLLALAAALADRGEPTTAAALLLHAESNAALLMRADWLDEAGDHEAARRLVERVLARDIDWPGARERRARWGIAQLPASTEGPPAAGQSSLASMPPLGPFVLLREAGRGGSATVYEAEDRDLGRRVALKVYHRVDRDRTKLLHEARVAVDVAGEGVVPIFDVDPNGGWLAMQFAPLGAIATPKGSTSAMTWARPLASALARVHAAGWVHHDVKPANVLLRGPGEPMLADFGIARRAGEASPPGSSGYVSPERRAGRVSDPADDIFGFGRIVVVLLEEPAQAAAPVSDPWRALAVECTGPDALRPRNGAELVRRIDALSGSARRR